MPSLFKSLTGRGGIEDLPEELQKLIEKARREKKALGEAVRKTEAASQDFETITAPLAKTQAAIQALDDRLTALQEHTAIGDVTSRLAALEERARDLSISQDQATESLADTLQKANDMEGRLGDLREFVTEVTDARDDLAKLSGPAGVVTKVRERLAEVENQMREIESRGEGLRDVEFRVDVAEKRAGEVKDTQIEIAKELEGTLRGVDELQAKFAELSGLEEQVSQLRGEVEALSAAKQETSELLGPSGMMVRLRGQLEELSAQLADFGGEMARAKEDQSDLRTSQGNALSKYEEVRQGMERLGESIGEAATRVAAVEGTLEDLSRADELAARTERHLNALRGMADHVTQKTAALELQRETADRAEAQLRNLSEMQQDLRQQLQRAEEQVKEVKKAQANIGELQELNRQVSGRTTELRAEQARIDGEAAQVRERLHGLEEEVRRGAERFRIESGNLEAIGQRIADLRGGVMDMEGRFQTLDGSVGRITEASERADALAARMDTLSAELAQLHEQAERVEGLREPMERADATAAEVGQRLERIEDARADVDQAVRDLATLRSSREDVRDALEQLRGARAEIERMQTGHTETNAWLATVQESIRDIRSKMALLDDLAGNVEHMRVNADRVLSAASSLDARRETLAVLEARMTELQRTGAQLDERTSNLLTSLDDADHRFKKVAERAAAADRVGDIIASVTGRVEQAERRMSEVGESVDSVAGRAEQVEQLSKRVNRVGGEIEQRQQALDQALEQLERVTALRSDAAEVVQSLETRLRELTAELRAAEKQSDKVGAHAERLEARAGSLRFAEKRVTQFEEKLAQLDQAEQELTRSLEVLLSRQESVDAVRDDLRQLFATASQTLTDVKAIAAARDEVEEARGALDVVLGKAAEMDEMMASVKDHQKKIAAAETRLAQAQGLLLDIRAGLETLSSQKAVVDHVIEQSGQLAFEAKEAEGLLEALRRERGMTQRIHDAVKELRDDDAEAQAS